MKRSCDKPNIQLSPQFKMSRREMKEELTCPICMELFRQPRRLPCGHSYCHVCIKAILERRTEENRSSLNRSWLPPLVCPECREEVRVDFVRGIEGIPPDFKLSKLVDLFQFMKTADDSDSSDDLQLNRSAVYVGTSDSSTLQQAASTPVSSVGSAPPVLSQPSESLVLTSSLGSASSTGTGHPLLQNSLTTVTNPQWQSTSTVSTSEVSSLPQLTSTTEPLAASDPSNSQPYLLLNTSSQSGSEARDCLSPQLYVRTHLPDSQDRPLLTSSINQLHTYNVESNNELDIGRSVTSGVDVANPSVPGQHQEQTHSFSDLGAVGGTEPAEEDGGFISTVPEDRWNYSPLHFVSASISRNFDAVTSPFREREYNLRGNRNVSVYVQRADQVSGRRPISCRVRSLSQSSVFLPAEITGETQSRQEASPQLDLHVSESNRFARAHSVPTETKQTDGTTTGHALADNPPTLRSQKERSKHPKSLKSIFVESSSDSSEERDEQEVRRITSKKKRWLMTRFLRSVIFSDSSSSESGSDEERGTYVERKTTTKLSQSVKPSPVTHATDSSLQDQHSFISSPRESVGDRSQTHQKTCPPAQVESVSLAAARQQLKRYREAAFPQSQEIGFEATGVVDRSVGCNILPKEITGWNVADQVSLTEVKEFYTSVPLTDSHSGAVLPNVLSHGALTVAKTHSEPDIREHGRHRAFHQAWHEHTLTHADAGQAASFYDNLNKTNRCGGERGNQTTRYDNVPSFIECPRPNVLVRNTFNQAGRANLESFSVQDRTQYDNINETDLALGGNVFVSSRTCRKPSRSPVTDIEELKTGYEHQQNTDTFSCAAAERSSFIPELTHSQLCCDDSSLPSIEPRQESSQTDKGDCPPSSYDNINNSSLTVSSVIAEAGSLRQWSNSRRKDMAEGSTDTAGSFLRQRQDSGVEASRDMCSDQLGASQPGQLASTSDEDLQFVDNYFEQAAEHLTRGSISLQNLLPPSDAAEAGKTGPGDEREDSRRETAPAVATQTAGPSSSSVVPGTDKSQKAKNDRGCASVHNNNNDAKGTHSSSGNDVDDEDEDDSHSGTSMLQNKKKPRSRLKKFLTSLLSLSSSSDDDEDENYDTRTSSSKSSDW